MTLGNEFLLGPDGVSHGMPSIRVRLRAFQIPPIRDAAILGRDSPVKPVVMMRALKLMSREPFAVLHLEDDTVRSIFVRKSILRKIDWKMVERIVIKNIKPLMSRSEILAVSLEIEIALGENY
jgi:hypothetical protein